MGGVLVLSTILALSLTFASCANSSDSDDENPSPTLPANVGENPITKTIRLNRDGSDYRYLELRTDGTALAIYVDDDDKNSVEETVGKYKYTYDDEKKTITMKLEKSILDMDFEGNQEQLMTYDEICSKINEVLTVEGMRESEKKYYEEEKNDEWFKKNYPGCNSYADYEVAFLNENGFASFDAYVKEVKREYENEYKAAFGAQVTYTYEIKDGKITLTEKFTSVKNLLNSDCYFSFESGYAYISCSHAKIVENDDRYYGTIDTYKNTIVFESGEDRSTYEATYTENISAGTVIIKFKDKEYVCEFEGQKFIQE